MPLLRKVIVSMMPLYELMTLLVRTIQFDELLQSICTSESTVVPRVDGHRSWISSGMDELLGPDV